MINFDAEVATVVRTTIARSVKYVHLKIALCLVYIFFVKERMFILHIPQPTEKEIYLKKISMPVSNYKCKRNTQNTKYEKQNTHLFRRYK